MTDDVLQMTGLIEQHRTLGAKLTDFGGWLMPLEYSGVIAEHTAVRTAAGMFDVSHMCPVQVSGPGAHDFANLMFTNDIGRITTGQAQYSLLCDESGGIVDDLLVYRGDTDEFHIIANAGNGATVVEILRANAPAGIVVDDRRPVSVIIAVQGPRSQESLAAAGISVELEYMSSTVIHHATWGFLVVSRTGYTGEKGYEVIIGRDHGPALWDALAGAGVAPCGLGARDTLRLEMGYPLHGNDISLQINPVQARLGWAIGWDKADFRGKAALASVKAAGPTHLLRGIRLIDRGVPRSHMNVVLEGAGDPEIVGETTSGGFGPTIGCGIALALVRADIKPSAIVCIDVRGRLIKGEVVNPPFVVTDPRA